MPDLREQLEQCFRRRVCLVGVGNAEWGDDGFGVRLAETLEVNSRVTPHASRILVAGKSPERHLGELNSGAFDHVIFLDAVEFGGVPGSVVFLDAGETASRLAQISTHKISLGTLAQWIEANGITRAWLLGVQPASLRPEMNLSPAVQRTLGILSAMLTELAQDAVALSDSAGSGTLAQSAIGNRQSAIP
jgi:hydrogenase maturation protease